MRSPCDQSFLDQLAARLPEGSLIAPEPRYLEEPRGKWRGQGGAVARPRSREEVAVILRACHEARVGLVPFGGGTGLVGGQVAPDGPLPLILSLERMRALRAIYPAEGVIEVEAGMTLQDVQTHAAQAGLLFPLSLASEGSATIGGNLATNAGGTQVLRYGTARALCLGIEAVLADGQLLQGLSRLRKDNTGYAVKDLLIGSEGTLGVITAASLRLAPRPAHRVVALLAVPGPKAAQDCLQLFQSALGGLITGFELISKQGIDFLIEAGLPARIPLSPMPQWSVLVELGLPAALDPEATMAELYQAAAERDLLLDGVIAATEAQADALWQMREMIPEANRAIGAIASHDISLPLGAIADFLDRAAPQLRQIAPDLRINCFGHLGDGNLHYNLFPARGRSRSDYAAQAAALSRKVHDLTHAAGGAISAEHGIGRLKRADLQIYGDPARLAAMRALKSALDPRAILNPGAVLAEPGR